MTDDRGKQIRNAILKDIGKEFLRVCVPLILVAIVASLVISAIVLTATGVLR